MEFDTSLTNEEIKKRFDSQFDLVNHLIHRAQDIIASGRGVSIDADSDNIAVNVVADTVSGREYQEEESPNLNGLDLAAEETEAEEE